MDANSSEEPRDAEDQRVYTPAELARMTPWPVKAPSPAPTAPKPHQTPHPPGDRPRTPARNQVSSRFNSTRLRIVVLLWCVLLLPLTLYLFISFPWAYRNDPEEAARSFLKSHPGISVPEGSTVIATCTKEIEIVRSPCGQEPKAALMSIMIGIRKGQTIGDSWTVTSRVVRASRMWERFWCEMLLGIAGITLVCAIIYFLVPVIRRPITEGIGVRL